MDPSRLARGFRLADWIVKPEDGSLTRSGSSARLEPLLMDLLVFLCARPKQVVSKQEILHAVWQDRYISDDTIKSSLYQIRKALDDDPRAPKILETLPKRGYRILVDALPLDSDRDLFEKGRAALATAADPSAFKQALLYLEKFLESHPDHPAALGSLARAQVVMACFGAGPNFWISARRAAERSLAVDANIADAHLALAAIRAVQDHELQAALREINDALEPNPDDPAALRWRARVLASIGHFPEAIADARKAVAADPLSVPARRDLLDVLLVARDYDRLCSEASELIRLAPPAADVHLGLAWIAILQDRAPLALDAFLTGARALGVSVAQLDQARAAFDRGGIRELVRLWIALLEADASMGRKTQNDLIVLHSLLGDRDRAFALVEATFPQGNPFLLSLAMSPLFDNLRPDPRFRQWIARLGLPFPHP